MIVFNVFVPRTPPLTHYTRVPSPQNAVPLQKIVLPPRTSRQTLCPSEDMFHRAPSQAAAGALTVARPLSEGSTPKPARRRPHTTTPAVLRGSKPTSDGGCWLGAQ